MSSVEMKLSEIANLVKGSIEGIDCIIQGVSSLEDAGKNSLSFLSNPRYESMIYGTKAAAIIVNQDFVPKRRYPPLCYEQTMPMSLLLRF